MSEQAVEMQGITAHLAVRDGRAAEAIDFYKTAFGAEERMRMPGQDSHLLLHAHVVINGSSLMLNDVFPEWSAEQSFEPNGAVSLHLEVDDADAWFERAKAAGAEVVMPLDNQFWGSRYGHVRDPFGFTWAISGPIPA